MGGKGSKLAGAIANDIANRAVNSFIFLVTAKAFVLPSVA